MATTNTTATLSTTTTEGCLIMVKIIIMIILVNTQITIIDYDQSLDCGNIHLLNYKKCVFWTVDFLSLYTYNSTEQIKTKTKHANCEKRECGTIIV